MSYRDGFEDAVELCLNEIQNADCADAILKIKEILELVKTDKIYRLKEMLWQIKK